ncbi:MAG: bet [Thermoleophilia bacterium]|nr:bet [Thermoleophilia bacterium]
MTSTALERRQQNAELISFTDEQVDVMRSTICRELNDAELSLFLAMCQKYALDPFSRQIYATKTGGKLTPITSIDGFRLIAQRSGQYAGQRPPEWTADGREWVDVWINPTPPAACRVSVLRHDWDEPMTVPLTWTEYTGGSASHMQRKMPAHMLAKATEAIALRKAFPNDLSGLYTSDEIVDAVPAGEVEVVRDDQPALAAVGTGPAKRPATRRRPAPTPAPAEPAAADAQVVALANDVLPDSWFGDLVTAASTLADDEKAELVGWSAAHGLRWKDHDAWTVAQANAVSERIDQFTPPAVSEEETALLEGDLEEASDAGEELAPAEQVAMDAEFADLAGAVDAAQDAPTTSSSRRRSPTSPAAA